MKTLKANYLKTQVSFTSGLVRFCGVQSTSRTGAFQMLLIIAISSMFAGCKKSSEETIVSYATTVDQYTITQASMDKSKVDPLERRRDEKIRLVLSKGQFMKYQELEKVSRPPRKEGPAKKNA